MSSPGGPAGREGLRAGTAPAPVSPPEGPEVGPDNHSAPRAPALCSPRADNWLVDTGEDEARSQGLSLFGQVSGGAGPRSPSEDPACHLFPQL